MKIKINKFLFLFFLVIPFYGIAQVNLTNGLLAHLPLNGNGNDISGNGNNAVIANYGVTPTYNCLNIATQAMLFDGANDNGMMSFATPLLSNRPTFSMSYWFNVSQLSNGMSLVGQDNILETGFYTGPNRITVFHPTGSANTNLTLGINNWQHLVVTCSGTEMKVYLNGVLTNTLAGNYSLGNNTTTTRIGGNVINLANNSWFRGRIDEVRFYNRVLTTDEVAILYSTTPLSIAVNTISGSSFCAGDNMSLNFTASGDIYNGNTYYLEMSSPTGSFVNPIQIASLNSSALTNTFNVTIPMGTPSGAGYKLRVVSNNLNAIGVESSPVTINGVIGNIPNPAIFRYIGNIGGKDYYVSLATQNLTNARNSCISNGGVLASIPNQAVNDLFASNLSGNSWMGFTDETTEGNFTWLNNIPVSYINWGSGQPDNASNEDYGELLANTGKWNDRGNANLNLYFMELSAAGINQSVCAGAALNLNAATVPGATYSWSGPGAFTSPVQNPVIPNITNTGAGIYTVTITNAGCTNSATTIVNVNQQPLNINQTSSLLSTLSTGLVLYYPMNGNANDASGGGNNGTLFGGVTATTDRFGNTGQALQLNGTNGYVDVPDGVYFNGADFTVSAWVRVAANNSWSRLFDFGNGAGNNNVLLAISNLTTGRPAAEIYNNTISGGQVASATAIPANSWTLLTYTFTNNIGTIFLNGNQIAQEVQTNPVNIVRTINYIGRSNWAGDAYANARFDDFRIYNRLLTSTEIQSLLYEQTAPLSNITTPASVCVNTSSDIVLYNTQPGVTYQLKNAVTLANVGAAQNGNGDSLVFNTGVMATTTTFHFLATNVQNGCNITTTPGMSVIVNPSPLAPTTTGNSVCNAGIVTLNASGASGGGFYNWYNQAVGGTPIAGQTSGILTTPFLDENRSYWVSITDVNGCEGPRAIVTATVLNPLNPPVDIISSLILHYKFDGNLADSSGNGYDATITGANTYINDRNGNPTSAINSTATGSPGNNWISAGNPAKIQQLTNQLTISVWIRQTQTWFGNSGSDGQMPLINKWDGGNGIWMGLHMTNPLNIQNRVRWRVDGTFLESTTNVPVGAWHHIVCTYNGAQLRIYQNGVLTGTLNHTGNIPNTSVDMLFGRQADGIPSGGITYRGDWDQAKVYNRALNISEVQTLYNNESVAYGNSPLCDGQANLTLSTFNFPGATYSWTGPNGFTSNVQNPPVITNATTQASGTYSLQVTNYGCTSPVQPVNIVVNPLPVVSISINDTVCGSGNADLVVGGAPAGSTYAWYTLPVGGSPVAGQTDSTYTVVNVTSTITYYVAATSLGCEGPRFPVTAVYNNNVLTNLTVTGSTVCSGVPIATITVNSSEPGVNYQAFFGATAVSNGVMGAGGTINLNVNTSGLSIGNNTITIIATRPGCGGVALTNTATVTIHALPTATITPGGPTTFCTGGNVNLTSSPGMSYLWSTGDVTQTINISSAGSYNVVVTGANGCTNTSAFVNVNVNPFPTPTINAAGATTFCSGENVTLSGGGGGTYLWSTGAITSNINVNTSGTYYVTVTLAGCSSTSSNIVVNVLPLPAVGSTSTPGSSICIGNSVTLNGTGAVSYTWTGGITDGVSFSPPSTATYTVTGTGINGCTNTATRTITVNPLPAVNSTASPAASICIGGNVILNGTGASSYTWSGGITNGISFSPASTATYTVTGTNVNGCINTNTITITVNPLPTVGSTVIPGTLVCAGTNVTLNGTGASTYTWSGSVINNSPFAINSSTTYTVTGTDANGCSSTNTISLAVNPLPVVDAGVDQSTCLGGSIIVAGTGAISYSWNNGIFDSVAFYPANTLSYTVTGTDINNCSNTDVVTVIVHPLPNVNGGPDQTSCNGNVVNLVGSGAVSYIWTGGVINGSPFVPTASATYTVTGTDANNCTNTDIVNIILGVDPVFSLGADIIQPNPPVVLDAGTGWNSIDWSTGASTQTININTNSIISCTVTNADGCSATDTVEIWFTAGIDGNDHPSIRISLYPNPNDGIFNMEIRDMITQNLVIEIFDMLGKQVFISTGIVVDHSYTQLINLENIRIGMYNIRLSFNGQQQQLRFIKGH